MTTKYTLNNLLRIADSYVNSDVTTFDGLEKKLISWFCFTYTTTPNDPRLLKMTLEELIVLNQMHRVKDNPEAIKELLNPDQQSYEDWLKENMGDSYISEEQMIDESTEYEQEEQKQFEEIKKDLPNKVTTDFSNLHKSQGIEKK